MLPRTAGFGPGERAAWVKQSIDICEKKGVLGAGYIPKNYQTTCLTNSEGLFAYYELREAQRSVRVGRTMHLVIGSSGDRVICQPRRRPTL